MGKETVKEEIRIMLAVEAVDPDWLGNVRGEALDVTPEFIASVKDQGILQNLVVGRKLKESEKHPLLAGFRRFSAALKLGMKQVPVRIAPIANKMEGEEINLIENIDRLEVNPVELAERLASLKSRGMDVQKLAMRTGKHFSTLYLVIEAIERLSPELVKSMAWANVTGQTLRIVSKLPEDRQDAVYKHLEKARASGSSGGKGQKPGKSIEAKEVKRKATGASTDPPPFAWRKDKAEVEAYYVNLGKRGDTMSDYERGVHYGLQYCTARDPETIAALSAAKTERKGERFTKKKDAMQAKIDKLEAEKAKAMDEATRAVKAKLGEANDERKEAEAKLTECKAGYATAKRQKKGVTAANKKIVAARNNLTRCNEKTAKQRQSLEAGLVKLRERYDGRIKSMEEAMKDLK